MFPGDFRAETMNTSQLFMVFGRTRMGQSATRNNPNNLTKKLTPASQVGSRQSLCKSVKLVVIRSRRNTAWNFRSPKCNADRISLVC